MSVAKPHEISDFSLCNQNQISLMVCFCFAGCFYVPNLIVCIWIFVLAVLVDEFDLCDVWYFFCFTIIFHFDCTRLLAQYIDHKYLFQMNSEMYRDCLFSVMLVGSIFVHRLWMCIGWELPEENDRCCWSLKADFFLMRMRLWLLLKDVLHL